MRIGPLNITLVKRASPEDPKTSLANPASWLIDWAGAPTKAGTRVSPDTALQYSAVLACVRILAETVASLPLPVYRRLMPRGKQRAPEHPLYRVLHDEANPEMTAFTFRETLQAHLAMWGNAYAEIEYDTDGRVVALWPLLPDRTWPERVNGVKVYKTIIAGKGYVLPAWRVFHVVGLGFDGIRGYSPIRLAREAIGLGLAAQEFGARLFSQGARPAGVLTHPGRLSEEAAKRLRVSWEEMYSGLTGAHRTAILEEGMKWESIGIPPEDAQFLQTRRFQIEEIARIYRIPPHMLGDLERATFSNVEHLSIEFVVHTMRPWFVRWEQCIHQQLFLPQEKDQYFAEFLVDGLLRGDTESRYRAYSIGRQWGWLSPNDIRELENMNPIPGGDVYHVPLNMVPMDSQSPKEPATGNRAWEVWEAHSGALGDYEVRAANIRRGLARSYKRIFSEAVLRLLKREEADIMRKARSVFSGRSDADFSAWLSQFYREHEEFVKQVMAPVFRAYAEAVKTAVADEVGGDSEITPEIEKFLEEYISGYIRRHTGLSVSELRKALDKAIAEGRDRLEALQQTFDEWRETRPASTAQEETIRAGNAIALVSYVAAGIRKVRWVASGASSCPYCRSLDGRVVDVDTPFLPKDVPFYAAEEEGRDKKPLVPGHDIKHPPAHKGCDCNIVSERADGTHQPSSSSEIYVSNPITLDGLDDFWIPKGSLITGVKAIAGKGTKTILRDVPRLVATYTLPDGSKTRPDDWQKMRGTAIITDGTVDRPAEVHWYQCEGIGPVEWKLKRILRRR